MINTCMLMYMQHVHRSLRLKKPEAQKSTKGPRAPGVGFEAKARAF